MSDDKAIWTSDCPARTSGLPHAPVVYTDVRSVPQRTCAWCGTDEEELVLQRRAWTDEDHAVAIAYLRGRRDVLSELAALARTSTWDARQIEHLLDDVISILRTNPDGEEI